MTERNASDPISRTTASGVRCPICGKPAAPRHRPFCSSRCADIDLGRWLKGNYRVETDEAPPDADDHDAG
ncbi:MAG TPA: DNA gyrase inhibitor YacG [Stellaceae bacterium]|nr:DNA gyrase inhibitor YacG [Stellaceae bacterium]